METLFFLLLFTLFLAHSNAQEPNRFISTQSESLIPDFNHVTGNYLTVEIPVFGLPNQIDQQSFGLEKVQLSINHNRISDVKVELISPDGTLVWVTNRNGRDGANYIETQFSQNGFRGHVSDGEAPFTGEYIPDGRFANFNNKQNPNGIWIMKVYDLEAGIQGSFRGSTLFFSSRPAIEKFSPCSLKTPKGCITSGKKNQWKLLPDLILSEQATVNNWMERPYSQHRGGGELVFEATTFNIGLGPLEVEGTGVWLCEKDTVVGSQTCHDSTFSRQVMRQVIYKLKKNKFSKLYKPAGTIAYDGREGHEHFHADNFIAYYLLEKVDNGIGWKLLAKATKASFCLWDLSFCRSVLLDCDAEGKIVFTEYNIQNYGLGNYTSCHNGTKQGLSVGGIDSYGMDYEGQSIVIPKGTPNGTYYLYLVVDPDNLYEESNENNNTLMVAVNLVRQQ